MPRPVQVYSFGDFASRTPNVPPPGDRLDAQFRAHADAIGELSRIIAELKADLARRPVASPRETLPVNSYPGVGGPYAGDTLGATATAADWAQVAIDWAEHMPDTIPGNSLAVTGVSGSHWSSRWWANNATSQISAAMGNYLPLAGGAMTGPLVISAVSNFSLGGGGAGQVLTTGGFGSLSWTTISGTFVDAPSNSQYYSRYNGTWVVSPGGLTDAPNDGTMYARKSQAWAHLTHNDITDWAASVPLASSTTPVMDGVAAVGVGTTWARADHVHPSDAAIPVPATVAPLMDGVATTGVNAKYARQDHVHPTDTTRAAQASLAGYAPLAGAAFTGATSVGAAFTANTITAGALTVNSSSSHAGVASFAAGITIAAATGNYIINSGGNAFDPQASLCVGSNTGVNTTGIAAFAGGAANYICMKSRVDRTDDYLHWFLWGASAGVGSITTNGTSVAFNTTSDYRLKTVHGDAGGLVGSMLDAVPVHDAEWKAAAAVRSVESTRRFEYRYPMFLAHEVALACPWAVIGDKDEVDDKGEIRPQQLDASKLVAVLWAEIRNLRKRVAGLEGGVPTPAAARAEKKHR